MKKYYVLAVVFYLVVLIIAPYFIGHALLFNTVPIFEWLFGFAIVIMASSVLISVNR